MTRAAAIPDRFRPHPSVRVFGPDGVEAWPLAGPAPAVIPDQPCAAALTLALSRGAAGLPFRIGAPDLPAPDAGQRPGSRPVFETLTSGSTGQPRRIRRSQRSWWASFLVNQRLFGIGPGVRIAVPGRMVHSLSLYGALEGACLGAEVHLLAGMRPDAQGAALRALGVEVLYATPAQLRLMLEAGGAGLPDLRLVLVGGSKLDDLLRAALASVAPGAELREFYGAAEASFITLADASSAPGSVGRPYPGVRLEIRAADGTVLPPAGLGEVWVRSPYLCDRYAGGQGLGSLRRGGWLSVGEMGWLERGELYLAGRAGRMVTVADQNVFPEEIELFLAGLPGVRRVAVLPRADLMRGHVLVAVMQGDPAQEAQILRAARARLGALKAPRAVIWRGDWPELPSGKADLTRIAAEAGL
ncbi:MAG: AMP-binding protein [Rhodobacteraceae bacterium]|nr:AMP-binding protein [Paracoccaceae bacterium]